MWTRGGATGAEAGVGTMDQEVESMGKEAMGDGAGGGRKTSSLVGRATWEKGLAGGDHLGRKGMKAGVWLEDRAEARGGGFGEQVVVGDARSVRALGTVGKEGLGADKRILKC